MEKTLKRLSGMSFITAGIFPIILIVALIRAVAISYVPTTPHIFVLIAWAALVVFCVAIHGLEGFNVPFAQRFSKNEVFHIVTTVLMVIGMIIILVITDAPRRP